MKNINGRYKRRKQNRRDIGEKEEVKDNNGRYKKRRENRRDIGEKGDKR